MQQLEIPFSGIPLYRQQSIYSITLFILPPVLITIKNIDIYSDARRKQTKMMSHFIPNTKKCWFKLNEMSR